MFSLNLILVNSKRSDIVMNHSFSQSPWHNIQLTLYIYTYIYIYIYIYIFIKFWSIIWLFRVILLDVKICSRKQTADWIKKMWTVKNIHWILTIHLKISEALSVVAKSAGAVEYTNCSLQRGKTPPQQESWIWH